MNRIIVSCFCAVLMSFSSMSTDRPRSSLSGASTNVIKESVSGWFAITATATSNYGVTVGWDTGKFSGPVNISAWNATTGSWAAIQYNQSNSGSHHIGGMQHSSTCNNYIMYINSSAGGGSTGTSPQFVSCQ